MKAMSEVVADCVASRSCDAVLILGKVSSGHIFRPGDWCTGLRDSFPLSAGMDV